MRSQMIAVSMMFMLVLGIVPASVPAQASEGDFSFGQYNSYDQVKAELERLAAAHPEICQLISIGQTWEGRDILAMRVSDNPAEEENEPDVLIMGGHHASELPSVEVPMYILEFLLGNYSSSGKARQLVDQRDAWFVPLLNPDGREYALNIDTSWRKNRRPIDLNDDGAPEGFGVDLNRNYGHLWSEEGASLDPGSSLYCGTGPFSENETQAIRDLATVQGFEVSLSYHTYGQLVYYPWGNSIDMLHPEKDVLEAMAGEIAQRIGYTPMEGKDAYFTTGDSDDWLYAETDCLPFTIELANTRTVPEDTIVDLCEKNLDAALFAMAAAEDPDEVELPDWTVMVYMSADADESLAEEAIVDINEMEVVGSGQDLNIVVLYDGRVSGDSMILHIQQDPGGFNTAVVSPVVDDQGAVTDPPFRELDMSDPTTLRTFTGWAMANYPAQRYLLDLWGHGNGVISGFCPDNNVNMLVDEISQALGGMEIDLVGFDACSMGHLELASELAGIADVLVGSQAEEPLEGWNYNTTLARLAADTNMGPEELAGIIVEEYLASNTESYLTQAAVDVRIFSEVLLPALNEFANVSIDFAHQDFMNIWTARNATHTFVPEQDAADLFEFLGNLHILNVSEPVMERIEALLEIEDWLVVASGTGAAYPKADAMALYFPELEDPISPLYADMDFATTQWDEYLAIVKDPAERSLITPTAPTSYLTTSGPYRITAEISGGISSQFKLFYRLNSGAWHNMNMTVSSSEIRADIPGQANGTVISYYFLDEDFNVTEPYEVKWGGEDYLTAVVGAACDLAVNDVQIVKQDPLTEGGSALFLVNCSNSGPEAATANLTLTLVGASTEIIGWKLIELGPGEFAISSFNWTAASGNWSVDVHAFQTEVFDLDDSNQEMTVWLNVSMATPPPPANDFLSDYGVVLAALLVTGMVPVLLFATMVRKSRKRRKNLAARMLITAKDFVSTAEEMGGDVRPARVMLARADDALSRGEIKECENWISKARESAMMAVGDREPGP